MSVTPIAKPMTHSTNTLSVFSQLKARSVNNKLQAMRKTARDATFVAGRLAMAGQITVFYAAPNTGKTLITLKLISEAIANGTAGKNTYHLNLDDTYEGLIQKGELGERYGFQVLDPEAIHSPLEIFTKIVDSLIEEGTPSEAIFILDTVKKFVDVMDKKASSQFMNVCRRFTSAGGTVIALAHLNKRSNENDEGIPAGTSDILDDCDCAYVLNNLGDSESSGHRIRNIEFHQKKARGPVVQHAIYQYKVDHDDYFGMFNSVQLVDGSEADVLRRQKSIQVEKANEKDLIDAILSLLNTSQPTPQTKIQSLLTGSGGFSRRKVIDCLNRWSCSREEGGLWVVSKGPANSNQFQLPI